jgi:hypothetical protein
MFVMPQKSFLDLNLKPKRGRLTLRRFYHPNAGKGRKKKRLSFGEGRKKKRLGEKKKWKEEEEIRGINCIRV